MNLPQHVTGRRVKPLRKHKSLADMIRSILFDHNTTLAALATAWGLKPSSVSTMLSPKRKWGVPPKHIDATIELFELDEFDATRLHRQAAIEAGYKIVGPTTDETCICGRKES